MVSHRTKVSGSSVSRIVLALTLLLAVAASGGAGPLDAQTNELRLSTQAIGATSTQPVSLIVALEHSVAAGVGGFSFGLLPGADLTLNAVDYYGPRAEFESVELDPGGFALVGVIFSLSATVIAPGTYEVISVEVDAAALPPGETRIVEFRGDLGTPEVAIEFATPGGAVIPTTVDGAISRAALPPPSEIGSNLWLPQPGFAQITQFETTLETVLGTLSGSPSGPSAPAAVAVAADGTAWVAWGSAGEVIRYSPFAGGTTVSTPIPLGQTPGPIALDRNGNVWVADVTLRVVSKLAPDGAVLLGPGGSQGPSTPVVGAPASIAVDRVGNAWVTTQGDDTLTKISPTGEIALVVNFPMSTGPAGIAVDREGFVWYTLVGPDLVHRRSSGGALVGEWPLPNFADPREIVIRRNPNAPNSREAWVTGEGAPFQGGVFRLQLPAGPASVTFVNLASQNPSGLAIDGRGQIWACTETTGDLFGIDPDTLQVFFTSPPSLVMGARFTGDATGYVQANLLFGPTTPPSVFTDLDGDGSPNNVELDFATDVFDSTSTPTVVVPGFVEPVLDLSCSVDQATVAITWQNATPTSTALRVSRVDSVGTEVILTTLSGTATSFVESNVPEDIYRYRVTAIVGANESVFRECVATVGVGQLETTAQIEVGGIAANLLDITRVPAADLDDPEAVAYYATDAANGRIYGLNPDYLVRTLVPNPLLGLVTTTTGIAFNEDGNGGGPTGGSLFVAGGGEGEQVMVREISLEGGTVLDEWSLTDPGGAIVGRPGGLAYSRSNEYLVIIGPIGCDIFAFSKGGIGAIEPTATLTHPTPSPLGFALTGVDVPADAFYGPGGGELALTTAALSSSTGVEQEYAITIYSVTGTQLTELESIPLASLEGENTIGGFALGDGTASVVGVTSSTLYEVLTIPEYEFLRGDCNGDGAFDLADPIRHLAILFSGAAPPDCEDACDANDSATLNIADPITLLARLFTSGPPPPSPFPLCGPDPTTDLLTCLTLPNCP